MILSWSSPHCTYRSLILTLPTDCGLDGVRLSFVSTDTETFSWYLKKRNRTSTPRHIWNVSPRCSCRSKDCNGRWFMLSESVYMNSSYSDFRLRIGLCHRTVFMCHIGNTCVQRIKMNVFSLSWQRAPTERSPVENVCCGTTASLSRRTGSFETLALLIFIFPDCRISRTGWTVLRNKLRG